MTLFNSIFKNTPVEPQASKINWIPLTELNQIDEIIKNSSVKLLLIFKHSSRCSISRMALKQFENEFDLEDKVTAYFLDLLNYREISNAVSEQFNVIHQSPQLLLIQNGSAIYDASHSAISATFIKTFVATK